MLLTFTVFSMDMNNITYYISNPKDEFILYKHAHIRLHQCIDFFFRGGYRPAGLVKTKVSEEKGTLNNHKRAFL